MMGRKCSALGLLLFASVLLAILPQAAYAEGGETNGHCSGTWLCAEQDASGQGCTYNVGAGFYCQTVLIPAICGEEPACCRLQPNPPVSDPYSCFNFQDSQSCTIHIGYGANGCSWCNGVGSNCPTPYQCCGGLACNPTTQKCELVGGSCNVPLGGTCTADYTPSGGASCCAQAAPLCVEDPVTFEQTCRACVPEGSPTACDASHPCCGTLTCNPTTHVCEAAACKNKGEQCTGGPSHGNCCQPPQAAKELFCDSLNSPPQPAPTCKECVNIGEKCAGPGGLSCCSSPNPQLYCDTTTQVCSLPAAPPSICGADKFQSVIMLSGIAALATAVIIALSYMFGEMFSNARVLTWAKTEAVQIFVSLIIVGAVIGVIQAFCVLEVGEIGRISTSLPRIYLGHEHANMYDAAKIYLENLMAIAHTNMDSVRYSLGAYEQRTTFIEMHCPGSCWITLQGYDAANYGGETLNLALTNNLLSTATISYLSAAFEYFTLQYILNGLFLALLPLAIVIRSVPFMRHFGGALVAIFLSLYLFYPIMLVMNSMVTQGMTSTLVVFRDSRHGSCPGIGVFGNGAACAHTDVKEADLGYSFGELVGQFTGSGLKRPVDLNEQIAANTLIFLATVFLAALNFIVIAAMARGVSRFLGEEADISRLGQMI